MANITKYMRKLGDLYELHLSSGLLVGMLTLFCAQIFIRYVLDGDTFRVNEASIIAFGWTSILGASYGFRREREYGDGHVQFTVLYDLFPEKMQIWVRILKHVLIIAAFLYMIPATWRTVYQYRLNYTTILKLPFSVFYAPFLVFLVLSIIHCTVNVAEDVRLLRRRAEKDGGIPSE